MSTGVLVWITGLPQSGKSTLARRAAESVGDAALILDSDDIRDALVPERGYTDADRDDFYASLANLAVLFAQQGKVVIVAATANRRAYRQRARERWPGLIEVHVDAPVETCEQRDQKGLYADASLALPGRGATYERPESPDLVASGGHDDSALDGLLAAIRTASESA